MCVFLCEGATWCVCKKGGQDKVLQQAIDYACGNGADCTQTHQGAKCFNPDTVLDHCNYAVNSYFQNKGQAPGSCDFSGAAMVTTTDPSANGCTYPTSARYVVLLKPYILFMKVRLNFKVKIYESILVLGFKPGR
ncbi:putative carbohydrate-binding X8 domain-containing protein, plant [Helianthus debilis subsp. tardiflorus]